MFGPYEEYINNRRVHHGMEPVSNGHLFWEQDESVGSTRHSDFASSKIFILTNL
jgi:hypothetical protein